MAVGYIAAGAADRLPPQNLDAERSVLGSCLLVNDAIDEVADLIRSDHFYSDAHRRIFATMFGLHESGRRVDPVILAEALARGGELEEIGGPDYIHEILESVPHAAHAKYYASIVRDKWIQRSLIYACTDILRDSYEAGADTQEVLERAEQSIFRILESQDSTDKLAIGDILLDAMAAINARLETEGTISGLGTGFFKLDELTNGFQKSELIVLAARPSMGKTALICNWAEAAAAKHGTGVLIFSLEQSKVELAERFLCIRAKINGHKLRAGDLDEAERHQMMETLQELSDMPLFIDDTPGRGMSQIGAICRRMKRQHGIGLVVIDYLQLIEPEDRRAPREQQVAQITRRLKFLAKELQIPLIALAQLNRGVETRKDSDKRPRLADLRESGAIEQDADVVMLLHRPEVYTPEDPELHGLAEVIIAKNRSGPVGMVPLTWRKEFLRFENFSGMAEPEGGYRFGSDDDSF
ncbi:MAG: replicative DNA helicase [Planctomycetales bacterium]